MDWRLHFLLGQPWLRRMFLGVMSSNRISLMPTFNRSGSRIAPISWSVHRSRLTLNQQFVGLRFEAAVGLGATQSGPPPPPESARTIHPSPALSTQPCLAASSSIRLDHLDSCKIRRSFPCYRFVDVLHDISYSSSRLDSFSRFTVRRFNPPRHSHLALGPFNADHLRGEEPLSSVAHTSAHDGGPVRAGTTHFGYRDGR